VRHRIHDRALACFFVSLVLATSAGCGSTASASSIAPIKIGVIEPENTSYYNAPDELAAARAAVRAVDAAGGIKGRRIEVDFCNSQNDPNATASCARELISDGVVAVDPSIDVQGPQMVEQLRQAGIPVVNETALYPQEFTARNAFLFYGGPEGYVASDVVNAADNGLHKIALVVNQGVPVDTYVAAVKAAAAKVGSEYKGDVLIPMTPVSDYAPYAQALLSSGADAVVDPLGVNQEIPLIQAMKEIGSKQTSILNDGGVTVASLASGSLNGSLLVTTAPPVTPLTESAIPAIATFAKQMQAEERSGDSAASFSTGNGRPTFQLRDWASLEALFNVMESINGTITAHSVMHALTTADSVSVDGVYPPWNPASTVNLLGISGARISEPYAWLNRIENGVEQPVRKDPLNWSKYL